MDIGGDILVNLFAGLLATAIVAALSLLVRNMEPGRSQRWAELLRRLGWPLLAFVFLASALTSAIIRETHWLLFIILGALAGVVLVFILVARFTPVNVPAVIGHEWQIMAVVLFLSTVTLFLVDITDDPPTPEDQIVFVVDMDDPELLALRDVLDELEPEIEAKIFLMKVDTQRYVPRLTAMKIQGNVRWDLIAVDNNNLGVLAAKDLVEDLESFATRDELIPPDIITPLRRLLEFDGVFYFAPFRPNVKIAFYNTTKFDEYGLEPPETWNQLLEVARTFKEKDGVGRVAIQGHPGAATGVTVFEFVTAAGGDPLKLDDEGSRRAFEFLQEIEPYLAPEYKIAQFDTAIELLITDQVYLVMNWPFTVGVLEQANRLDILAFSGWRGDKGERHVLGGDVLAIPRDAPHPQKAVELIKLLLSVNVQQKLFDNPRWLPVRTSAYEDAQPPLGIYAGAMRDALGGAVTRPKEPQWTMVEDILDLAFGDLVRDGGPIENLQIYAELIAETVPPCFTQREVRKGETFQTLAENFDTTPELVARANQSSPDAALFPGEIVLVPEWSPGPDTRISEGICLD